MKKFAGNGMSKTAMLYHIARVAGHKLSVPELNRIKEINAHRLEQVYNEIVQRGGTDNASFALKLMLG